MAELTLHNNYRLRLKDLNYAEKIKEVEDKFQDELSGDKLKYSRLLSDKESMEASYEDRIFAFEQRQAREVIDGQHVPISSDILWMHMFAPQLEELESTYKGKIAAEIERYDKLIASRDVMSSQWDKDNSALIAAHQQHIVSLVNEHDVKIAAEEVCVHSRLVSLLSADVMWQRRLACVTWRRKSCECCLRLRFGPVLLKKMLTLNWIKCVHTVSMVSVL